MHSIDNAKYTAGPTRQSWHVCTPESLLNNAPINMCSHVQLMTDGCASGLKAVIAQDYVCCHSHMVPSLCHGCSWQGAYRRKTYDEVTVRPHVPQCHTSCCSNCDPMQKPAPTTNYGIQTLHCQTTEPLTRTSSCPIALTNASWKQQVDKQRRRCLSTQQQCKFG